MLHRCWLVCLGREQAVKLTLQVCMIAAAGWFAHLSGACWAAQMPASLLGVQVPL